MSNSTPTINPTNTIVEETSTTEETAEDIEFDELDEELIIEDFTIDGICGVY